MNPSNLHIATWIYCDSVGEESEFGQVSGLSSTPEFQAVYWRCVVVYFATSLRNNPKANHLLFTNVSQVPDLGDFKTGEFFAANGIKVVSLPFTYQTPVGYFGAWRNQFYIFDILKYLSTHCNQEDIYLILDSDCVWVNSADKIISEIEKYGLLTYEPSQPFDEVINGLNRLDMKKIYEELNQTTLTEAPIYFGGEWFGAKGREIKRVSAEFEPLWEILLKRFENHQPKFNEEAHVLSYIYHKLGYPVRTANPYFKRIWTSSKLYDASPEDLNLDIWHVLSEKVYGIKRLFTDVRNPHSQFWNVPTGKPFLEYMARYLGIPKRTPQKIILDTFDDRMSGIKRRLGIAQDRSR